MQRQLTSIVLSVGLGVVTACASSSTPSKAQSPAATHTESLASEQASVDARDVSPVSSAAQEEVTPATPATEPTPEQPNDTQLSLVALKRKATPIDVMTGRETAYLIDYANSGAVAVASAACAEKAKKVEAAAWAKLAEKAAKAVRDAKTKQPLGSSDAKPDEAGDTKPPPKSQAPDPAIEAAEAEEAAIAEKAEAVRTECLRDAREKFEADVLRFRRDGLGHIKLVIYRRNGSALKELYVANVELDDSSANKVKVEIKESGSGKRPIMRDRSKFELLLPNEYSLEFEDPQFGRLPYVAKVGLVAN